MWDYEVIKHKWEVVRPKAVLALCCVLIFLVGVGVGEYNKYSSPPSQAVHADYTTKKQSVPTQAEDPGAGKGVVKGVQTPVKSMADGECVVKGNIGSGGKKIYHVAGGAFYKTVKPEQCFKTEAEAKAAGYVKSSR